MALHDAAKKLQMQASAGRISITKETSEVLGGLKQCELEMNELKHSGFWFTSANPLKHQRTEDWDTWSPYRQAVDRLVSNHAFEAFMGLFILFQLTLAVQETDIHSQGDEIPEWVAMSNLILLIIYSIEITLRAFALRISFFHKFWNVLDLSVVSLDVIFLIAADAIGHVPSMATLRMVRLVRLARTLRAVTAFNELQIILHLFSGAMKALVSAFVLLTVVCTIFSIIAVELIQPIVVELDKDGEFGFCSRCPRAFESVMQGNLTWFQTIVLGDEWGAYFTPVIEHTPSTAIFFVSVTVIVALGLLNILMSVIVTKGEDFRRMDQQVQLQTKLSEYEKAKKMFLGFCESLDHDKSGTLSLQEIQQGMEENEEFANALRVLDVEPQDLTAFFEILDSDNSGTITYSEFIENLHKMKSEDSHTLLVFIQHYCQDIHRRLEGTRYQNQAEQAKTSGENSPTSSASCNQVTEVYETNAKDAAMPCLQGTWSPLPSVIQTSSGTSNVDPSQDLGSATQEPPIIHDACVSSTWEPLRCASDQLLSSLQEELRQLLQRSHENSAVAVQKSHAKLEEKYPQVSSLSKHVVSGIETTGLHKQGPVSELASPKTRGSLISF